MEISNYWIENTLKMPFGDGIPAVTRPWWQANKFGNTLSDDLEISKIFLVIKLQLILSISST